MWILDTYKISQKLDLIISMIKDLQRKEDKMALDLTNLSAAVDSMITAVQDAVADINTLVTAETNTVDPVALQAITDKLTAAASTLETASKST